MKQANDQRWSAACRWLVQLLWPQSPGQCLGQEKQGAEAVGRRVQKLDIPRGRICTQPALQTRSQQGCREPVASLAHVRTVGRVVLSRGSYAVASSCSVSGKS